MRFKEYIFKKDNIIFIILIFYLIINILMWKNDFYDVDSYYYAKFANSVDDVKIHEGNLLEVIIHNCGITYTRFFLLFVSCVNIFLFYCIIRNFLSSNISLILSFIFCFDPIYNMQVINIMDKPVLIIFLYFLIIDAIIYFEYQIKCFKKSKELFNIIFLIFIYFGFLYFIWSLWYLVVFFSIIIFMIRNYKFLLSYKFLIDSFMFYLSGIFIFLISLYTIYRLIHYNYYNFDIVNELLPVYYFFSPFFIIYILSLAKLFNNKIIESLFILIPGIFIFRLLLFSLIYLYIGFGFLIVMFEQIKIKYIKIMAFTFISILIIMILILNVPLYSRYSYDTKALKDSMNYINELNTSCIVSDWGIGHIYQFHTNKTVINKANPKKENILKMLNAEKNNCTWIYSNNDIKTFYKYYKIFKLSDIKLLKVNITKSYNDNISEFFIIDKW